MSATIQVDVRVCFLGDSLTAGVGDAGQRGWVGRIAEQYCPDEIALTHYNLGVRTDTSTEVLARSGREVAVRLPESVERGLVVSFGVNDARAGFFPTHPVEVTVGNLVDLLDQAGRDDMPVLVVGLLPVADHAHNERSARYDAAVQDLCAQRGVPFVEVFEPMLSDPVWMREVPLGDGLHPGPAGYQELADLIGPRWAAWLRTVAAIPGSGERGGSTMVPDDRSIR